MNPESNKFERTFLAKWIAVTCGGFVLGLPVSFIVAHIGQAFLWGGKETNLAVAPCIGAAVGCAQWLMLRSRIAVSGWWVLACAIGVGVPFMVPIILDEVGFLPHLPGGKILGFAIVGIIGGLLSGLLQMPLLRPHFAKAGWWILASSIGWGVCWLSFVILRIGDRLLSSITGEIAPFVVGLVVFLALPMGPILLGVVTGVGLLWIAKLPVQKQHDAVKPTNR